MRFNIYLEFYIVAESLPRTSERGDADTGYHQALQGRGTGA